MNRLLCTTLVFGLALINSANCQTTQDVSRVKEGKMVTNIQKYVESLLAMKGSHFLNIEARSGQDVFQVTKSQKDGKTTLTVLIMYPFTETAEKTFNAAGVKTPTGWKVADYEKGDHVAFDASGSDATIIAVFADAVFTRLLKSRPTDFLVDPE